MPGLFRGSFICAIGFILVLPVFVAKAQNGSELRFVDSNELLVQQQPLGFTRNVNATTPLWGASGVFISREGYFLTAMHVVLTCLAQNGATETHYVDGDHNQSYVTVNYQKALTAKCVSYDRGNRVEYPIVAIGPGYIPFQSAVAIAKHSMKKFIDLTVSGIAKAGDWSDFAILKIPAPKEPVCVPAVARSIEEKESLWSLGFPGITNRRNGHDSTGRSQYFSSGHADGEAKSNACFTGYFKSQGQNAVGLNTFYSTPGSVWTTLDGMGGSSGSPIFSESGELIGLATAIFENGKDPATEFCPATKIVTLEGVKLLLSMYPLNPKFESLFDCPK